MFCSHFIELGVNFKKYEHLGILKDRIFEIFGYLSRMSPSSPANRQLLYTENTTPDSYTFGVIIKILIFKTSLCLPLPHPVCTAIENHI